MLELAQSAIAAKRSLTAEMNRSHTALTGSHESLTALVAKPMAQLGREPSLKSAIEATTTGASVSPSLAGREARALGESHERLRYAFVLSEVLFRPPLAVRRPLPTRRRQVPRDPT